MCQFLFRNISDQASLPIYWTRRQNSALIAMAAYPVAAAKNVKQAAFRSDVFTVSAAKF